jgi:hypothetical protein
MKQETLDVLVRVGIIGALSYLLAVGSYLGFRLWRWIRSADTPRARKVLLARKVLAFVLFHGVTLACMSATLLLVRQVGHDQLSALDREQFVHMACIFQVGGLLCAGAAALGLRVVHV